MNTDNFVESVKTIRAEADQRLGKAQEACRVGLKQVEASANVQASLTRVKTLIAKDREAQSLLGAAEARYKEATERCIAYSQSAKEAERTNEHAEKDSDEAYERLREAGHLFNQCFTSQIDAEEHDAIELRWHTATTNVSVCHRSSHHAYVQGMARFAKASQLMRERIARHVDESLVVCKAEASRLLREATNAHETLVQARRASFDVELTAAKARHAADLRKASKCARYSKRAPKQAAIEKAVAEAVKAALAESEIRHNATIVEMQKEIDALKVAVTARAQQLGKARQRVEKIAELVEERDELASENFYLTHRIAEVALSELETEKTP